MGPRARSIHQQQQTTTTTTTTTTTPSHRTHHHSSSNTRPQHQRRTSIPPRLTPSSSASTGTSSSMSSGANLRRQRYYHQQQVLQQHQQQQAEGDESILRGAALVRKNILAGLVGPEHATFYPEPSSSSKATPRDSPLNQSSFSASTDTSGDNRNNNSAMFDEWSDVPWGSSVRPPKRTDSNISALSQGTQEYSFRRSSHSILDDDDGQPPNIPARKNNHWASMALSRREPPKKEYHHPWDTPRQSDAVSPLQWDSSFESSPSPRRKQYNTSQSSMTSSSIGWDSVNSPAQTGKGSLSSRSSARSGSEGDVPPPPPPVRSPASSSLESSLDTHGQKSAASSSKGTHVTTMGREKSLKLKIYKYNVQSNDSIVSSRLTSDEDDEADQTDSQIDDDNSFGPYVRSALALPPPSPMATTPTSAQYKKLCRDTAYQHARSAGLLWQSLAGQHVRFPKTWWDGCRAPLMGAQESPDPTRPRSLVPKYPWQYLARHRVRKNKVFNHLVKNRGSAGRLLLHVIVQDLMSWVPTMDIAIGCFHPNARGIRERSDADPSMEPCREVWLAVRRRTDATNSVIEPVLCRGLTVNSIAKESPLGDRRKVSNMNMRAVFGETPPIHTIVIQESELYEKLQLSAELEPEQSQAPALMLLQEFLTLG